MEASISWIDPGPEERTPTDPGRRSVPRRSFPDQSEIKLPEHAGLPRLIRPPAQKGCQAHSHRIESGHHLGEREISSPACVKSQSVRMSPAIVYASRR